MDTLSQIHPLSIWAVFSLLIWVVTCQRLDPITSFCRMLSNDSTQAFAAGDRFVLRSPVEQKARSILGTSTGNEFLKVSDAVLSAVSSIAAEVSSLGGAGMMAASARVPASCVYRNAISQPCSTEAFREPTGRCTSLTTKTWGMAGTPFSRILPPKYQDGFNAYRTSEFRSRKPLKSPRLISVTVTTTNIVLNGDGPSAHVMQWGQFISHEFTLIGDVRENTACCPDVVCSGLQLTDTQIKFISQAIRLRRGDVCIPIEHFNDPVYGRYICIQMARSKVAPVHNCGFGPRQQMNMITHVIDGSAIYGSSQAEATALRQLSGGKMKSQIVNGATLPPCAQQTTNCPFLAGDKRVNTTPNLAAYHTLFVVLHNKIAAQLSSLNPQWNDERIYQETRRIVAAIEGNIHYYEYLPVVLGQQTVDKYKLGTYGGFQASVNPSVPNELAGAAFRFGHSSIDGFISLIKDSGFNDFRNLTPMFFDVSTIHQDGIKQCVRGLTEDLPWIIDRNYPTQMRDELYNKRNDIVSLNINRGRDHGFASYLDYRRHYRLPVPADWSGLSSTHPQEVVEALKQSYTGVEDIELYIGGVTENHVTGGLVGETFANIIADSFSRLRTGDRLFYESPQSGLTAAQIAVIKKYKHSNLLCDGSDIDKVSSKGFFRIGTNGATEVECSTLTKLDLTLWKVSP